MSNTRLRTDEFVEVEFVEVEFVEVGSEVE